MRALRSLLVPLACAAAASCASTNGHIQTRTADDIRAATGAAPRFDAQVPSVPPGVRLDDGLSRDEAVALALWNNATFQVQIAQLGFARADLAEAGMVANPVLSLLLPVGPKQLEATLRWPVEVLWERPKRVASATLALDAAAKGLVQSGLDLALSVRLSYADLALTADRQALASEAATVLERIDRLTRSRLAAGDIAELDARAAQVDATRARQEAERATHDVAIARDRLRLLMGLAADDRVADTLEPALDLQPCGAPPDLLKRALVARPDLRAAELGVEAAAARLGWERSRVLSLTAALDANGEGREGFEMGPGFDIGLPLFSRNQGGRLRAETELRRASAAYVALQQQVGLDVREASTLFDQASQSRRVWRETIVTPLRSNLADAESSFAAGENSYLFVLENSRRLIDARVREREISADQQRAEARIERAIGAPCAPAPGGVQ